MDATTARVVRGFLLLNESQRSDFVTAVNEVINGLKASSKALNEADYAMRVNTGPVMSVCTCCGR